MNNFPTEILLDIFTQLSRETKLQCAVVCKSWSTAALLILNSSIHLRDTDDTTILFKRLHQMNGSIQGSTIRHLSLSEHCVFNDRRANELIFGSILSKCTHLTTLETTERQLDSDYHLQLLINNRDALHLKSLQRIKTTYTCNNDYLLANWLYHDSINQLHLFFGDYLFDKFEFASDLYVHLNRFQALKVLRLELTSTVYFHSLLSTCPQLESLQLDFLNFSSREGRLGIYDIATNIQQIPRHIYFKCLKVSAHYISQELFDYIRDRVDGLIELTVQGSGDDTSPNVKNFFDPALALDQVLSIKRIKFTSYFQVSRDTIVALNGNFGGLRSIDFHDVSLFEMVDQNGNLEFDFDKLNLDYLSIDLRTVSLRSGPSRRAFSLVLHTNGLGRTVFYHRDSKRGERVSFINDESSSYIDAAAQRNRISSSEICVITIKASALRCLHLHNRSCSYVVKFSQFINLN